jgi:hypothetical protein
LLEVTHMTYARVATDAAPSYPELRPIDTGINDFLADHIRDLRQLTVTRQTQPGRFVDEEAQALFRSLRYDKTPEFLATVDSLMKRLIGKMDHRAKPGLLICLRANEGSDLIGGALKLQVVAEHGAVLERLDSGDEVLSAVTDLLDKPGELQKGALVMSTLPEGQVLTGDRLIGQDAIYFPTAFGIQLYARPSESVGELLDAVEATVPELVAPVAAELPSVPPGTPEAVRAELGNRIPELDGSCQADVAQLLEHRRRPIGMIDTGRRSREQIKIGEITISGPIDAMRQYARINHLYEQQRWQVVVEGTVEPKRSHR